MRSGRGGALGRLPRRPGRGAACAPVAPNLGQVAQLSGPACSDWSRQIGLDPVGTAGSYQGYLLVEQPLPWPEDVSGLPELAQVAKLASAQGLRLQALFSRLLPTPGGATAGGAGGPGPGGRGGPGPGAGGGGWGDRLRMVHYRPARSGWAGPLVRYETLAKPGELLAAAEALLDDKGTGPRNGGTAAGGPEAGGPEAGGRAVGGPEAGGPVDGGRLVDVLVCTHGRRDSCCGARGTELFGELLDRLGQAGPAGQPGSACPVRAWRTSHTGGHRFAPTALVLPSATLWAWADVDLLLRVVRQEGPLDDLLGRHRGCALLASGRHQALERAVLTEVGWPLLGSYRQAQDGPDGRVRLVSEVAGEWEATVREARRVPQPECHTPPELAVKQGVEWAVEDLRHVSA